MEDAQREWKLERVGLFYELMSEYALDVAPDRFWFELTPKEFWEVYNSIFSSRRWLEFEQKRMESGLFKESALLRG